MPVLRCDTNPIIQPKDIRPIKSDHEVIGVFNAGVARLKNEIILLLRVAERPKQYDVDSITTLIYDLSANDLRKKVFSRHDRYNYFDDPRLIKTSETTYLTSFSYLCLARSGDGIHFTIEETPACMPESAYEIFGLEDPRITQINSTYYIDYVAVSPLGVVTYLVKTDDFHEFERLGIIFGPEHKDVVIFPESISGRFYALHRPTSPFSQKNEIWLAESPDLICWGRHRFVMGLGEGGWDQAKIGPGAVPFRIEQGWLEIYHGVDQDNRYCLGAMLLSGHKPWQVISRSKCPILKPEIDYECKGFFGNVVFTCGLLFEEHIVKIYYGAADTTICYAEIPLEDILNTL